MKKIYLLFCLIFLLSALLLARDENFEYLANSQSLNGYSGYIITPSPYVVDYRKLNVGLHRFDFGFDYGIMKEWEGGINLDLKESFKTLASTSTTLFLKYRILKQYERRDLVDCSVGTYGNSLYFLLSRQFSDFFDTIFESGVDFYWSKEDKFGYFVSISKPTKYSSFIFDYKSYTKQTDIGWRVLLSPDIKLDLFLTNADNIKNIFDNFVFGLTLAN